MKKHWIIICALLLVGCQKQKPDPTFDLINYTDFSFKNYFIENQKSITIDFKNDVFNHGLLIDMDGRQYNLEDKFDSLKFLFANENRIPLTIKKTAPFVYKFSASKENYWVSNRLIVSLYNSKTNVRSHYMNIGNIYCLPERKDYVEINTIDDFKNIKGDSTVILKSDIDFEGFDFKTKKVTDENCIVFTGIFVNPGKHVIKNINYNSTSESEDFYFLFKNTFLAFFDSLIFDNVHYQRTLKDGCHDCFGFITKTSLTTTFQNIQMNNFSINYSYGICGSLTGISDEDNFINNKINGKITCKLLRDEKTKRNISGGLAGIYSRSSDCSKNYWFNYQTAPNYYFNKYYQGMKTCETTLSLFEKYYDRAPQINIISNNKLNVDIEGDFAAGGIFGAADNNNIDSNTTNSGKVTGKYADSLYGINYIYWWNCINWDTTLEKD